MPIRRTSLFASNPNPDHRTLSLHMVGERRRIFLIRARREGAYSENHFFAAARALRPAPPPEHSAFHHAQDQPVGDDATLVHCQTQMSKPATVPRRPHHLAYHSPLLPVLSRCLLRRNLRAAGAFPPPDPPCSEVKSTTQQGGRGSVRRVCRYR